MRYLVYLFDDGGAFDILDDLGPGIGCTRTAFPQSAQFGAILREDNSYRPDLSEVAGGDLVYVIGHGAEGYKVLSDSKKNTIDQSEVVSRLTACKLPRAVAFDFYVYACESALGGTTSLAARIATALEQAKDPTNGQTAPFTCADRVYGFNHKVSMKAHQGALCVKYGNWEPYTSPDLADARVCVRVPPNHYQ